jgi:hypothetical protein
MRLRRRDGLARTRQSVGIRAMTALPSPFCRREPSADVRRHLVRRERAFDSELVDCDVPRRSERRDRREETESSLRAIIVAKRVSARPKDLAQLPELEALLALKRRAQR